jgi:hypothetical protein
MARIENLLMNSRGQKGQAAGKVSLSALSSSEFIEANKKMER